MSAGIAGLYNRVQIETADQAAIIKLLHHKCVRLIQVSLQAASPDRKRLNAAQNILAQFEHSLNTKEALSQNFFLLYDYCYSQLETNNPDAHRVALSIVTKIRDAFDAKLHRP